MYIMFDLLAWYGTKKVAWGYNYYCLCFALIDTIQRSELEKREADIKDLTESYTAECKLRSRTEQERNQLIEQLVTVLSPSHTHEQLQC